MVQLKGYKVNHLEIENTVKAGTQLKLQNQVKYNVNYLDNNTCIGILELRITDADMQPFEFKVQVVSEFSFDEGDDKAEIHTTSFDQIFPFVRQIVNTTTSFTGMPGLFIPIMRLNKDTVRVGTPEQDPPESSKLN